MDSPHFCPQCGAAVAPSALFCQQCGNRLAVAPVAPPPIAPPFVAPLPVATVARPARKADALLGFGAAALVAVLAVGGLMLLAQGSSNSPTASGATSTPFVAARTTTVGPTASPVPTPTPPPLLVTPASYQQLGSRGWAQLMKSPDDYLGQGYIVWACISQFDSATGPGAFRGQAYYKNAEYWYLDGTNAVFVGDEGTLRPFVQDDVVLMNTIDLGSYSYETTIGGTLTVPEFAVVKITRKGSC
jgi:hypothetical protein